MNPEQTEQTEQTAPPTPDLYDVYAELERRSLPLIEAYHADLTKHDREWIKQNPGTPFIHTTRDTGTHLVDLVPSTAYPPKGERVPYLFGTADREHILRGVRIIIDHMRNPHNGPYLLWLYYNGVSLREITPDRAHDIGEQYITRIRAEWARQEPRTT